MLLRAGYAALALKLQESADELSSDDVAARLRDALSDKYRGSGTWAYFITYFGDSESGEVVFSADGDTRKASYEMSSAADKSARCTIDFDHTLNVVPRTIYEEEADEADTYAQMAEAFKRDRIYTGLPLYERFISKKERDAMDATDFAGKNRSYPVKTQADVDAAFHALGRAGADNFSVATIRANIIRIAKRKGLKLPKSAEKQATESATTETVGALKLKESAAFPVDITLREAFGDSKRIKIISPGKGSSAFYPAEVLRRDGPKVFKAGTPMRIDHPTRAEEAARPEGSVRDWGAVLAEDAVWMEAAKDGPGLYSSIKAFSDHAQMINEKGPYAGVSIRACGNGLIENGKQVMRDGVPVLAELTAAEGVDMVTRAGAGGMFLSESARTDPNNSHEGQVEMDEAKIKELIESGIKAGITAAVAPLRERALRGDAMVVAGRVLAGVAFNEPQKQFVIEEALKHELPLEGEKLDENKFGDLVMAEARRLGSLIGTGGRVTGFGLPLNEGKKMKDCPTCDGDGGDCEDCGGTGKVAMKAKTREAAAKESDDALALQLAESLGMGKDSAARAAKGRG